MNAALVLFCLGLVVLLFSTQQLVKLAEKLSQIFHLSPLIVGVTIVAIGTSLPELSVSLVSIIKGEAGLAVGNLVGSNIINILMVLPVGILMGNFRIGTNKTQKSALILLVATSLFFLVHHFNFYSPMIGLIFIGLAGIISLIEYQLGVRGRQLEDINLFAHLKNERLRWQHIIFATILISGIIAGSILVVESIETISILTGFSTTILGLTLSAIATSLPELLATIFSQRDHQEKMTIGNIIGSNIYNLLLLGGIIMLFPNYTNLPNHVWVWLLTTTFCFVLMIRVYRGGRPTRLMAVILLLALLGYLLFEPSVEFERLQATLTFLFSQ